MAKLTSKFFTTKTLKSDDNYRAGVRLYVRGSCIGHIHQDKVSGLFYVAVVNRFDDLFDGEFQTFAEADQFAWLGSTANSQKAA